MSVNLLVRNRIPDIFDLFDNFEAHSADQCLQLAHDPIDLECQLPEINNLFVIMGMVLKQQILYACHFDHSKDRP